MNAQANPRSPSIPLHCTQELRHRVQFQEHGEDQFQEHGEENQDPK